MGLLFASWAAAVFSWQLLQVATLVGGLAKLYLDGVRQQVRHSPASGLGCPGVSAIINGPALLGVGSSSSHHGGGYVVQLSGGGVGGTCHGAGASVGNGNGTGSSCYVGAVREATSAAAIATGLCPNGNGNGHHGQHNGGIGGMVSGGANGCTGAANGHGTLLNGCASSADAPCSPTAAGSSGGSSAELVLSCCSSAYSLHSASITAVSGCEQQGYSGTSSRDVVAACPAPSAGTSGASGSAGGGGGAGGQSWYGGGGVGVGGGAQLARRVLPAASSAPLPAPAAPGHHGVPPLSPGSGLGAGGLDAGAGGLAACHSVTLGATGAAAVLLGVGGANGNGHPHHAYLTPRKVGFADSAAAASGGCAAGLAAAAACGRRYARAALRPWSLLLACLTAFAGCLWAILITPPLAVLGDGPGDLYMGVLETPAGSGVLVAVLAGAALSGLGSAVMLAVCAASGELWKRWSGDRLEGRRLQCLAWAAGPAAAVAATSAVSWALGDERNVLVFVAAESLHCACLWPLVWLQVRGGLGPWKGMQGQGVGVTCGFGDSVRPFAHDIRDPHRKACWN